MTLQLILGGILSCIAALVLLYVGGFDVSIIITFSLCIFFVQFQELIRVKNITLLSIGALFRLDILTHCMRLLGLGSLLYNDVLSTSSALFVIMLSAALGTVFYINNYPWIQKNSTQIISVATDNWSYGRWLVLESLAYSMSTQIYLYLTAIWVNVESVGALNAIQNMLNMVNIVFLGLVGFVTPVSRRRILEGDFEGWKKILVAAASILLLVSTCTWIGVSLFADKLLAVLYKPVYAEYSFLIWILGVGLLIRGLNSVLILAFRTAGLPQIGFRAQILSAVVTLLFSYPLLSNYGVTGAAIGLVASQSLWLSTYLFYIFNGRLSKSNLDFRIGGND